MAKVDKATVDDTTRKQAVSDAARAVQNGESAILNPEGIGGFQDHPELRSNGRWDKDTSISYWYNKLGRMSDVERAEFKPTTSFQRIALLRIERAERDDKDSLDETKEITDRTEGKARQDIGLDIDEKTIPLLKGFIIPALPDNFAEIPDEEKDTSSERG